MNFVLSRHALIRAIQRFGREYARTAKPSEPVPDWLRRKALRAWRAKKSKKDDFEGRIVKQTGRMVFVFAEAYGSDPIIVTVHLQGQDQGERIVDHPPLQTLDFGATDSKRGIVPADEAKRIINERTGRHGKTQRG